ncbi:MAG: hypothetical protein KA716_11490 [Gloeotrichia echinulata DEX184]|nr:hypothetical protein [Gloeotrichia echinulata DEX184]
MKCINCGTDNNLKDRTGNQGRCIQCQHPFVFEPTSMGTVKITDPFFAKAITDISANNTLFFTPKQFFYLLDNRLRGKSNSVIGWLIPLIFFSIPSAIPSAFIIPLLLIFFAMIGLLNQSKSSKSNTKARKTSAKAVQVLAVIFLIGGIFVSLSIFNSFILFTISVIIGMLFLYLGNQQARQVESLPQEFIIGESVVSDWLKRWQEINGLILKLVYSPRQEIAPTVINPDVTAYSFDRLVVCDSAVIAQLLIANNFHFENNCAILSITGYPQSIFNTTMEMLRRNPELKVYALHDCSPQGVGLVQHLGTSPNWFSNSNVVIIDVGLLPRQIMATKRGMFIRSSADSARLAKELSGEIRQSLSTEELAWLESGKFVELESFTPQRLIKVLQQGIAGSYNLEGDNSNLIIVGDTGNDMYVVESFG